MENIMARNADFSMSVTQSLRSDQFEHVFATIAVGENVRVEFIKRNGEARTIEGEFIEMCGRPGTSSLAATVDTEQGPRSANLWGVQRVTTARGSVGPLNGIVSSL